MKRDVSELKRHCSCWRQLETVGHSNGLLHDLRFISRHRKCSVLFDCLADLWDVLFLNSYFSSSFVAVCSDSETLHSRLWRLETVALLRSHSANRVENFQDRTPLQRCKYLLTETRWPQAHC